MPDFKFSLIKEIDVQHVLLGNLSLEQVGALNHVVKLHYDGKLINLIWALIKNGSFNYRKITNDELFHDGGLASDLNLLDDWLKHYLGSQTGSGVLMKLMLDPLAIYTEQDMYISEYDIFLKSYLRYEITSEDPESLVYNLLVNILHTFDMFFLYQGLNDNLFYSTSLIVMRKEGELLIAIKQ